MRLQRWGGVSKNILKDIILQSTVGSAIEARQGALRKVVAVAHRALSAGPAKLERISSEFMGVIERQTAEVESWREPGVLIEGEANPIDAGDLRHWIDLAQRAGVPHIPAVPVLSLTDDEYGALSAALELPELARKRLQAKMDIHGIKACLPEGAPERDEELARDVKRRAMDALDEVPSNWMVRSHLAASQITKSLAGTGILEDAEDTIEIDAGLTIGPGFLNIGNRRTIDTVDHRFLDTYCQGHKEGIHFLARPWVTASRHEEGDDPHRHGSVFAGKGRWPAEWRVFVENGEVVGVSSYYAWCGSVTPEAAHQALAAVDAAERILREASRLNVQTRLVQLEQARRNPVYKQWTDRYPRDGLHCSLDFIETAEGLMLLEGGPAHTPFGGAYPCGFAGNGVKRETGLFCDTRGVALRLMDHVNLMEPQTWVPGHTEGRILSWDEARDLAAQFEARPAP